MNDYVTMHHFEKYFQITDLFIEKLKGDPSTADYLLDQAKMLMEKEYYDEALPLYQKTATAFPDRIEAKSDIGAVYSKKGDIIHARDIFKEVFMTDGKDQINLKNYIFTSILTEDFTTAFKLYEEICELDKDNYSHYFDIGFVACLLDKDYKTYLNHFREKHKVTVKSIEKDFWYQNASVLLTLDTKSKKEKIEFYEYLLEQFNNSGMYALALISSNMIKKIEVTNLSLIIPASIFDRFNFYEKTIEYLNKISERRKTDESIMSEYNLNSNYGRISYVAKKYRDSITFFSRCFRQKQDNAWLNHYLGMSHLNLNEIIEAKKYFVINSQMNDKGQMTYINNSIRELKKLDSSN
jgi:tetratricopeptide (TPR) repeat protein